MQQSTKLFKVSSMILSHFSSLIDRRHVDRTGTRFWFSRSTKVKTLDAHRKLKCHGNMMPKNYVACPKNPNIILQKRSSLGITCGTEFTSTISQLSTTSWQWCYTWRSKKAATSETVCIVLLAQLSNQQFSCPANSRSRTGVNPKDMQPEHSTCTKKEFRCVLDFGATCYNSTWP